MFGAKLGELPRTSTVLNGTKVVCVRFHDPLRHRWMNMMEDPRGNEMCAAEELLLLSWLLNE